MNRFSSSVAGWIGALLLLPALGGLWQVAAWEFLASGRDLRGAIGNPQPLNDRIFHYSQGGARIEKLVFTVPVTTTIVAMVGLLAVATVALVRRAPLKAAALWGCGTVVALCYVAVNLYLYAFATNTFI